MKCSSSFFVIDLYCALLRFLPVVLLFFFEVKDIEKSVRRTLFVGVWSNNNTKEWKALAIEVDLPLIMSLKVLNGRIDVENGVAMVPGKLLNTISIHLILNFYLLLVWYLTVFKPICWNCYTTFWRVYFANYKYFDLFFATFHELIGVVLFATEHSYDLVLGQVRMYIHKDLYLKGKIDAIRLIVEALILLAIHQIKLT